MSGGHPRWVADMANHSAGATAKGYEGEGNDGPLAVRRGSVAAL